MLFAADNQCMSEAGRRSPEVGTYSADGSRRWDGQFWVPQRTDRPPEEFSAPYVHTLAVEIPSERRGLRFGAVMLAAAAGLVLSFIPIPAPDPGSVAGALREMVVITEIRFLVAFAAVVLILGVGRQGIDVLLLRAMLAAFLMGATVTGLFLAALFLGPIQVPVTLRLPWPIAVIAAGLTFAVTLGPVFAVFAAIANLIWYRSLRSLRPQLGVFNRGSSRAR
jgi:hypothetical protein